MKELQHHISVGQKKLRCGYTTGTCAAAASYGSGMALLTGCWPERVTVPTPAGIDVTVELECCTSGADWTSCGVRKDGGDDPDVTHGTLIFAKVEQIPQQTHEIEGGIGVGRVTRAGLDQGVGHAAINKVPRQMIGQQLERVAVETGCQGGLKTTISVPEGVALAKKTFNPRLGIEGGISILGTSGIVRPMSEDALVATLKLEMNVMAAAGRRNILMSPGNYGMNFGKEVLHLPKEPWVNCSNYLGHALDHGVTLGLSSVLLVGHLGKLVKVAGGIFQTHSKVADGRREILTAHTALAGGSPQLVQKIFHGVTTDEMLLLLEEEQLKETVMLSVTKEVTAQLNRRVGEEMAIEVVLFTNQQGVLGMSQGAQGWIDHYRKGEHEG